MRKLIYLAQLSREPMQNMTVERAVENGLNSKRVQHYEDASKHVGAATAGERREKYEHLVSYIECHGAGKVR